MAKKISEQPDVPPGTIFDGQEIVVFNKGGTTFKGPIAKLVPAAQFTTAQRQQIVDAAVAALKAQIEAGQVQLISALQSQVDDLETNLQQTKTILESCLRFDAVQTVSPAQRAYVLSSLGISDRLVGTGGTVGQAWGKVTSGYGWITISTSGTTPAPAPPAPAPAPGTAPPPPAPAPGTAPPPPAPAPAPTTAEEAEYQALTNDAVTATNVFKTYNATLSNTGTAPTDPDEVQYQALSQEATVAKITLADYSYRLL